MRSKVFLFVFVITLFAAATGTTFAQRNVFSRAQVDGFVRQLEISSDAFHIDYRTEVNNSGLNASTRRRFLNYGEQFENAVDRLRSRFNSNDSWWESRNEVRNLVTNSQNLNNTMNTATFRRRLERQWNRLRNDINRLASAYEIPGLSGGGFDGGGGGFNPGRGGNVPNWAVGTFYGRNPQTGGSITLNVDRNGSVAVSFDGDPPSYGTLNGTTLNYQGLRARFSRLNNGIRATRLDNGEVIDYYRDGSGGGGFDPPPIGGGNVPNWALGTFYGRNPQTGGTIILTIGRDGNVSISFDGAAVSYATLNGTTLNHQGIQARISRLNNGIRATRLDNGEVIDYYRSR